MSYSIDMRERALQNVQEGMSKSAVCRLFKISRQTLHNWMNSSSLSAKKVETRQRKLSKEALAAHVREYPDMLLRERAAHFGVRVNAIWVACKVLKISKKNDALR
jgi:transposase